MSVLKRGTLCVTVGHRYTPSNNGRIVRVLRHVGAVPTMRIADGYVIQVVNGVPFTTITQHLDGGDRLLIRDRDTRCTAERSNLRPLLYPGTLDSEKVKRRGAPARTISKHLAPPSPVGKPDGLPIRVVEVE